MIHFYKFLLYMARFELAVARSTGRRQESIAALINDERRWEKAVWDCQNPLILNQ